MNSHSNPTQLAPIPLSSPVNRRLFFAVAIFAIIVANLSAQTTGGTVTFGNNNSCRITNGPAARPVITSDNISAALYWAPLGSNTFVQIGAAVANVGAPLPGLFVGGTRTTGTNTAGSSSAQFRVRAWAGGYATYELAAQNPGVLVGQSSIITNSTGNPAGVPPTPPVSIALHGLAGFALTADTVSSVTVTCATNKTVGCTDSWTFDTPTASSTCANTNVTFTVVLTTTNWTCPLTVTRTWQANDSCGNSTNCNQTVTVLNTQAPVITCATNKIANCTNTWAFDPPTAVSCTGSNLLVDVMSTVTNVGCPQVIVRTWQAIDSCNNLTTNCSQAVTVLCTNCVVIQLTKNCPPNPVPPSGLLTFIGTVTNGGIATLTNLVVVNDKPLPNTIVFGPATLAPGAGATFTSTYTVPGCGPFTDTLVASATGVDGFSYSNSVTATCPGTNYMVPGDLNGDGIVDQTELNAVLSNYWAHSPWLAMTNPTKLAGGLFQFSLTNNSGWNFSVLVSTNLNDWTNLPGPAYPVYQFFDPAASSNAPQRFYRLRYP